MSLSAADPERMASSIASLARAGFPGAFAFECGTELVLPWGKTGAGGGGAIVGAGGGGGCVKRAEVQVKFSGEEGELGLLSSSDANFLNFSSSWAAADLTCRTEW